MFDEIRPYRDSEVRPVLDRLVADKELLKAVRELMFKSSPLAFDFLLLPVLKMFLKWQVRNVHNVEDFQHVIEKYMDRAVESSCTGFDVRGVENIPRDKACLFVGNHRDIALDPAFMGLALRQHGMSTCRIAIGDNLLSKPYVADLMRLNKCFIVNRSATGPRQMLAAYQKLSAYIEHSICDEQSSVWIAQREGRAKDGNDRTEPAIIKMLSMNGKKNGLGLSEQLDKLCIVPVSISYEFDPCDESKAKELLALRKEGGYAKAEHEDLSSIAKGITGDKGAVQLSFCSPLKGHFDTAKDVANAIDTAILSEYHLYANNLNAYRQLHGELPADFLSSQAVVPGLDKAALQLTRRITQYPKELRELVMNMYATPVQNKLSLRE